MRCNTDVLFYNRIEEIVIVLWKMKTAFDLSLLFYIPFITNSIDSIDDA